MNNTGHLAISLGVQQWLGETKKGMKEMRNLKVLGLAFVAALAMSAVAASAASAEVNGTWVTAGSTTVGHDVEGAPTELTGSQGVKCSGATYDWVSNAGNTLTLTPTFSGCKTATGLPVTVTTNGCHYHLLAGTTTGDTAPVTAALQCPESKKIEVHIYLNAAHTQPICTISISGQPNLAGLTAHNETNGHTLITGTIEGIKTHQVGAFCATSEPNATLHVNITGTNLALS